MTCPKQCFTLEPGSPIFQSHASSAVARTASLCYSKSWICSSWSWPNSKECGKSLQYSSIFFLEKAFLERSHFHASNMFQLLNWLLGGAHQSFAKPKRPRRSSANQTHPKHSDSVSSHERFPTPLLLSRRPRCWDLKDWK